MLTKWITAIAFVAFLGLSNAARAQTCTSAAPSAPGTTATSGLFRVFAYGVANATSVLFPTWGEALGQDDVRWYNGVNAGGGTWYADVDLSLHKSGNPEYTRFNTHVYANGSVLCAATTFMRVACSSAAPQSPTTTATSGLFRIYAYGVQGATSLTFPTWAVVNGQDDIAYYTGTNQGGGTWYADVNLANHKLNAPQGGTFTTHVYANDVLCAATSFVRNLPNTPPTVSMTVPATNTAFQLGTALNLRATASDDVAVTKVQYYANGTIYIGQAITSPFSINWAPTTAGFYTITARAFDGGGLTTDSAPVSVAIMKLVSAAPVANTTAPVWKYHVGPDAGWNLPEGQWHIAARHFPTDPVSTGLNNDFSRFFTGTGSCPFPLSGGYCTLTNFRTATPYSNYQRGQAGEADGTPNTTSAFQQYGSGFGSFINTFESGCAAVVGGAPHSVFEFRFPAGAYVPIFDGSANTEFMIEADLEVPWFYTITGSRVQLSLYAYFKNAQGQNFALLFNAYDNVASTPAGAYYDTVTPFMSTPFTPDNQIMSFGPVDNQYSYSAGSGSFRTTLWKGLTKYRAFVTRQKILDSMATMGYGGQQPENFQLYNFGVLHEVFCAGGNEASTAYHGANFRAYSVRFSGQ